MLLQFCIQGLSISFNFVSVPLYCHLKANSFKEKKQLAVFLSSIERKTRKLTGSHSTKEEITTRSDSLLKKYFDPKPAVIAERFKFHKRDQLLGEILVNYIYSRTTSPDNTLCIWSILQ